MIRENEFFYPCVDRDPLFCRFVNRARDHPPPPPPPPPCTTLLEDIQDGTSRKRLDDLKQHTPTLAVITWCRKISVPSFNFPLHMKCLPDFVLRVRRSSRYSLLYPDALNSLLKASWTQTLCDGSRISLKENKQKKLMNKYFEWVEILLYYGIPYVSDRLSPELSFLRKWCALGNSNYFKAANPLQQLLQKSTSKWYWTRLDPANKSANCPKCEFFLQHDTLTDYPIILRDIQKMISGSLFKAYNKLKETHFI